MKITAEELKNLNVIDSVIQEPYDGAHESFELIAELLKDKLVYSLKELMQLPKDTLVEKRYQRYRKF